MSMLKESKNICDLTATLPNELMRAERPLGGKMKKPANRIIFSVLPLLLVSLTLAQTAQHSKPSPVEHIGQPMINGQRLPFSDAVRVGDMLYLSAVAGERPDGTLLAGFDAQARQAMDNVGLVLKKQGLGFRDLVKCTVLFENMDDWPAFNKIYATYFPDGKFPARTSLGVDGLPVGALIEIECWAYAGNRPPPTQGKSSADPLEIAPEHYTVEFENDRIRILRFVSRPGDKWAAHRHPDGVHISLSEYRLRNVVPGNAPTESHRKPGEVRWVPAVIHTGENIGSTEMRSLIIELKK